MTFGKHLIIDANDCQGDISNKEHIQNFIDDLCELSHMNKKGETIFEFFPPSKFNIEKDIYGWSVVQIISLSNITIHINFISRTIYLDFFTCGIIKKDLIHSLFLTYFKPKNIKKIILNRDAIDLNLPFIENI